MKRFDLRERLIDFSVLIFTVVEKLPRTYAGVYFAKQLVRCGTAPAFYYAAAQNAESAKDFYTK